ncbi:MAG TPA: hypothetical protein VNJ01_09820 [Bacteriovoracaceae bacterium]|nr:hypothetical protein [Bacteriovoracaceae bacterium]
MFKIIIGFFVIFSATCQASGDLVCYNPGIIDTAYVATFKNVYRKKGTAVTLAVPLDAATVKSYSGSCATEKGPHYRIRCQVKGDRGDLYFVTLAAVGGKRLVATATQMGVDENPYPLPICK